MAGSIAAEGPRDTTRLVGPGEAALLDALRRLAPLDAAGWDFHFSRRRGDGLECGRAARVWEGAAWAPGKSARVFEDVRVVSPTLGEAMAMVAQMAGGNPHAA